MDRVAAGCVAAGCSFVCASVPTRSLRVAIVCVDEFNERESRR